MSGTLVGEYEYDAWGNLLNEPESDVLLANPFRYRGYYYDTSIGLYYLNSRYYDPETGRFLNEDLVSYLDPETIGGINLYAYCGNDPVNHIDPSGHKAEWWQWLLLGAAAVLAGVAIGIGLGVLLTANATMSSLALLGAHLLIDAGSGFLTGAATSLWVNGDPMEALKAGGISSLIGFAGGVVSYTSGILGRMLGNTFGQGLAGMTVRGMQVGKAFSSLGGSQMISSIFSSVGSFVGEVGGFMFVNHVADHFLCNRYTAGEEFKDAVEGKLQSKILDMIYRFIKWMI